MTVNSSIPLSFQAPQQMSVADLMNMRNMQLQMAMQQAQLQALPQQQQMKAAMQQASLAEMQAKTRNYAAQAQDRDITMEKGREDFAKDSIAQELAAYKGAGDPQTGMQRALQIRSERIDLASKSGRFSPAEVQQMRNAPAQFDPAMASARLENWDTMIAQRKETAKLAAEPPKTRERIQGTQEVQEQWDPATRSWSQIGTGPRFKPKEAAGEEGKPLTDIAKLEADHKAGRITDKEYEDEKRKKTGSTEGLTIGDKMNPVMRAAVELDTREGRYALDMMKKSQADQASPFYADEGGKSSFRRWVEKEITPIKQQKFDVYANRLDIAIASAQSMGRGLISDTKVREAKQPIPVIGEPKEIRELKLQQLDRFFDFVDNVLKTPVKAGARTPADEQQDVNDFSGLWK